MSHDIWDYKTRKIEMSHDIWVYKTCRIEYVPTNAKLITNITKFVVECNDRFFVLFTSNNKLHVDLH